MDTAGLTPRAFCSSQGPFSVLVGSLLDNLTKQRRVLVTSCRLYRQLPTKTEMDQSGLTGLSVPDLVPFGICLPHVFLRELLPRSSSTLAHARSNSVFVCHHRVSSRLWNQIFKERWKFPSVFDGFNITDSQHIVNQFFLSRSFRVSRSEPLFLSI